MRSAHRGPSRRAVAVAARWAYHAGMNTKHFLHLRSESAITTTDYGFHDFHAATKKALERWENEGGRIPESGFTNDNERSKSRGNG
jgi:hypothetical protein